MGPCRSAAGKRVGAGFVAWKRLALSIAVVALLGACARGGENDRVDPAAFVAEESLSQATADPEAYGDAENQDPDEVIDTEVVNESDEDVDQCHDSYSGACVPVDQGEVDCGDLFDESFDVVGYDDFGLDADGDSIACEPLNPIDEDDDGCHDSYSGVCVQVDEGDLDCADIGAEDIDVIGEDTFNLDADYDGLGCEPYVPEGEEFGLGASVTVEGSSTGSA